MIKGIRINTLAASIHRQKCEKMLQAVVSRDCLQLNGERFAGRETIADYLKVLGEPDRVITPKAPWGYPSPRMPVYDSLGLYLNEDHATTFIKAANFVFDRAACPISVKASFEGLLDVMGQQISATSDIRAFLLQHAGLLTYDYLTEYSIRTDHLWVGLSLSHCNVSDGKCNQEYRVGWVSVCFPRRASNHCPAEARTTATT